MLGTAATCLACRRPAFWEGAVTKPTVRTAGFERAHHHVGAAWNTAWICTTTVFGAATLASRGGSAARHGAWPSLAFTVRLAKRSVRRYQTSGAACKLAYSTGTMFVAKTACCSKGVTAIHLAHFRPATAVFDAPSP